MRTRSSNHSPPTCSTFKSSITKPIPYNHQPPHPTNTRTRKTSQRLPSPAKRTFAAEIQDALLRLSSPPLRFAVSTPSHPQHLRLVAGLLPSMSRHHHWAVSEQKTTLFAFRTDRKHPVGMADVTDVGGGSWNVDLLCCEPQGVGTGSGILAVLKALAVSCRLPGHRLFVPVPLARSFYVRNGFKDSVSLLGGVFWVSPRRDDGVSSDLVVIDLTGVCATDIRRRSPRLFQLSAPSDPPLCNFDPSDNLMLAPDHYVNR